MAQREEQQHQSPRDVPPVGRPRSAAWRSLQADGVVWEGQVLLVGDDVDLAARMIVTHRRVAFVRGGEIVLEIPRVWMRQEPVLRRDGVLELFVAAPGGSIFDEPTTVPIRMREGHPAAGHIIAMLAPGGARRIAPDALSGMERAREAAPAPTFGGFWDTIDGEPSFAEASPGAEARAPSHEGEALHGEPAEPAWRAPEGRDRVIRVPSTPPRQASGSGFPIAGIAPRDQRRSPWGLFLRVGALVILLATAAALGAGRLQVSLPGRSPSAVLAEPSPTPAVPAAAESPAAALTPDELTAVALGVGGGDEAEPGTEAVAAAQAPTETPAPAAATPPPTATPEPTAPPIPTPAAAASPPPATAAAPMATAEPAATVPAVAEEATPGASPATEPAPAQDASPAAVAATQQAAVPADEPVAQEIVVGTLRVAFPTALRAETLPRYGLPPGSGEWVLLVAEIANEGDAAASLALPEVRLFDRAAGQVYDLDGGTGVIASLAGFDPAYGPGDTVTLEPGATARALLLYLLPPGSGDDLALIVGQSSLDVAPLLAAGDATVAGRPELLAATVTAVRGGDAITVDLGGTDVEVRYLGIAGPTGDACYAPAAAAANEQLVGGQQVWLERQASDAADGTLLRDVWIATPNGGRALVAARLLEAGAGIAAPVPPDVRYQAWLAAAEALGRTNGAGLWGACPPPEASAAASLPKNGVALTFLADDWRARRWGISR
jgi:endonuclease YncB( thermonuclease family)